MIDSYTIRIAEENERVALEKFLDKAFYPQEPLSICMGLTNSADDSKSHDNFAELGDRSSLVAVDKNTGNIIGCCVCGELDPTVHEQGPQEDPTSPVGPMFDHFLRLLDTLHENGSERLKEFNGAKILTVYVVAVDPEATKRGIARALLERTVSLAKERGYQLLQVDCTSAFSSKVMEKMGMECISSLKYEDFKDESGKPIFNPPYPHQAARQYILKL